VKGLSTYKSLGGNNNSMKRKLGLALVAASLLSCGSLVSCGSSVEVSQRVKDAIADAETMTHDQLFKKAAEELGTTGQVKILATTSRGGKAKNLFVKELQKYNKDITEPLKYDTTVDGLIYDQLQTEIAAGTEDGYCGTVTQDGYQLQTKGIDTKSYGNFISKTWRDAVGTTVAEAAGDPFTLQYNFKTWMYNKKNSDVRIDNVWDVTHSSFKNRIDTMNPRNENVNMDWLIQLTEPAQEAKLKAAFEKDTADTDVKIEDYAKYGSRQYSYAFIDKFLANASFWDDDGAAINHLAAAPGNVGWIVYSKLLKVNESNDISKANLVVAALGEDNDGTPLTKSNMDGFAGFMYKHYLQLLPNCKYPYATCAFFELISTTKDGYKAWATDVGDYPTMTSINMDRSKGGHGSLETVDGKITFTQSDEGENLFPCLNDPSSDWWINTADSVIETPSYIGANYNDVIQFINAAIAKK
jgi:hypothetical protein